MSQRDQSGRTRRGEGRSSSTVTTPSSAESSGKGPGQTDASPRSDRAPDRAPDRASDRSKDSSSPQSRSERGGPAAGTSRREAPADRSGPTAEEPTAKIPGIGQTGRTQASSSKDPAASREGARQPRRARLRLTEVDPYSVMKTAFLLSIALGIVSVVAVAVIWVVLGVAGVFDSTNDTVQTLLGNDFRVQDYVGTGRILGFTMIVAVVNVVLLTAIATLAAFLYNLAATLLGGIEVTLTEDR